MKFGLREVTDIVFKTKIANQVIGATTIATPFTPVLNIDTAKMSTMENTVSTVYAQGGRGNPRVLGWDGDRTATFKIDNAITTTAGLAMILGSGMSLGGVPIRQQVVFGATSTTAGIVPDLPTGATIAYVAPATGGGLTLSGATFNVMTLDATGDILSVSYATAAPGANGFTLSNQAAKGFSLAGLTVGNQYIIDFYTLGNTNQIQIEPGRFGGYYYIEANTLFRDFNGFDHPAQITIPKGKIKSNLTLTMAPTGDPTNFAFEIDAMPDTTIFVTDKKVLYTLDISYPDSSNYYT
jgi:hypothetical protein